MRKCRPQSNQAEWHVHGNPGVLKFFGSVASYTQAAGLIDPGIVKKFLSYSAPAFTIEPAGHLRAKTDVVIAAYVLQMKKEPLHIFSIKIRLQTESDFANLCSIYLRKF